MPAGAKAKKDEEGLLSGARARACVRLLPSFAA